MMNAEADTDAVTAEVYEGEDEDEGLIGLIFENAPCISGDDVASGICMTPAQARFLAGALLQAAAHIESS